MVICLAADFCNATSGVRAHKSSIAAHHHEVRCYATLEFRGAVI
jgi:hypothetical protein